MLAGDLQSAEAVLTRSSSGRERGSAVGLTMAQACGPPRSFAGARRDALLDLQAARSTHATPGATVRCRAGAGPVAAAASSRRRSRSPTSSTGSAAPSHSGIPRDVPARTRSGEKVDGGPRGARDLLDCGERTAQLHAGNPRCSVALRGGPGRAQPGRRDRASALAQSELRLATHLAPPDRGRTLHVMGLVEGGRTACAARGSCGGARFLPGRVRAGRRADRLGSARRKSSMRRDAREPLRRGGTSLSVAKRRP